MQKLEFKYRVPVLGVLYHSVPRFVNDFGRGTSVSCFSFFSRGGINHSKVRIMTWQRGTRKYILKLSASCPRDRILEELSTSWLHTPRDITTNRDL